MSSFIGKTSDDIRFRLHACDNLELLRTLEDNSVDLVVTSPPYNIGKSYEVKRALEEYLADQKVVLQECSRVLKPTGSICWQTGNHVSKGEIFPLDTLLYEEFKRLDLKLRNRVIWHYEHGLHGSRRLSGRYETIMWYTPTGDYRFNLDPIRVPSKYPNKRHYKGPKAGQLSGNPLGKNPGDVWSIPNVKNNHIEKTNHPCQFPVELIERLVLSLTNPGDTVFDPYMGVGSALIAAIKHERHAIGCDIDRDYVDTAHSRIIQLMNGTLKTRPMNKPVFDPTKKNGGH